MCVSSDWRYKLTDEKMSILKYLHPLAETKAKFDPEG